MDGVRRQQRRAPRCGPAAGSSPDLGDLAGTKIAVWGLTYKPGTDTLRRSDAIELCRWLVSQGASVHVHDPAATATA